MKNLFLASILNHPLRSALFFAILGAASAMIAAPVLPAHTRVSLAFTVAEQSRQETADYSYDGYYALRASELVADTLISWLSTPSVIKELYAGAGITIDDARAFAEAGRTFRAKKLSSQNVIVTFGAADPELAKRLADQAGAVLSGKAAQLVRTSRNQSQFSVTASEPVIATSSVPQPAAGTAGFCFGGFIGFAIAYWMQGRKNRSMQARMDNGAVPR